VLFRSVAVTGATGFIGSHVVAELNRRGLSPVVTSRSASQSKLAGGQNQLVNLDLNQPPREAYRTLGAPDVVIHLAWGGLPNYLSSRHFERELPAQFSFLKGLVAQGLPKLLVSGTCHEYGMQTGALGEDMATRPVTPYGFAKDALRTELGFLQQDQAFQLTWARLFYVWGEGQRSTALYTQLSAAVKRGDKTFDMSGGEHVRDYSPVHVIAENLVSLALRRTDDGVVNVCSGVPTTVRSLVDSWIADNGWQIEPIPGVLPYPTYEPMEFWGDREKLDQILGEVTE